MREVADFARLDPALHPRSMEYPVSDQGEAAETVAPTQPEHLWSLVPIVSLLQPHFVSAGPSLTFLSPSTLSQKHHRGLEQGRLQTAASLEVGHPGRQGLPDLEGLFEGALSMHLVGNWWDVCSRDL